MGLALLFFRWFMDSGLFSVDPCFVLLPVGFCFAGGSVARMDPFSSVWVSDLKYASIDYPLLFQI